VWVFGMIRFGLFAASITCSFRQTSRLPRASTLLLLVKCGCLFDDVRTEMTWSSVKRQKIGRSSSETRYRKSCSKT